MGKIQMKSLNQGFWLILCLFCSVSLCGQIKLPSGWQSSFVRITSEGKLIYIPDEKGNTIPDFSQVGYHHGNRSLPFPKVADVVLTPVEGKDNRPMIQAAIDEVSRKQPDADGHRGTILLKRGLYPVHGTIQISQSGIVLMGDGDNVHETCLLAVGKERFPLIKVSGKGRVEEIEGTRVRITDHFVPVGTTSLTVEKSNAFRPGDRVIVFRPGTDEWIHDIRMDCIVERKGTRQWKASEYNLSYEREVIKVEGKRIYIDNPIVMQMEKKYGGGEVYKYTFNGRIREVGVMNICLESEFEDYEDTNHGWIGLLFDKVENCWARNITCRYFGYAGISCDTASKNVTVADCRCLEMKSMITGGFRYSFNNCGQQNLFMNCQATEGRHDFVTGAKVCGPNVFYNCIASQTYADIGPHHRWASGTLYDNIYTDGEINVQDRGNWGSGHGWAGVTQVLWNCMAKGAAIQSPWASGDNYCIGLKGKKVQGRLSGRPDARWEGQNESNIFPRSLYVAQLMARHKNLNLTILNK